MLLHVLAIITLKRHKYGGKSKSSNSIKVETGRNYAILKIVTRTVQQHIDISDSC